MTYYSMMQLDNQNWFAISLLHRSSSFWWYQYNSYWFSNGWEMAIWKWQYFRFYQKFPIINKWAFLRFSRFVTQNLTGSLTIWLNHLKDCVDRYLRRKFERNQPSSFWIRGHWSLSTFELITTLSFDFLGSKIFWG